MTNLKEKYKNLEEVLIAFKAELQALQPRDSESIWWERGLDGIYAHVIDDAKGGGGGSNPPPAEAVPVEQKYHGYFTIKNVSSKSQKRVAVVDGDTWDSVEQSSGVSWCKVNNSAWSVPMTILNVTPQRPYLLLRFTAQTDTDPAKVDLFFSDYPLSDTEQNSYYEIGRVFIYYDSLRIVQKHTGGIGNGWPQLSWIQFECNMGNGNE